MSDWKEIHKAIRWEKPIQEIQALIKTPADANAVDPATGNYPIHIAAQNGHTHICKALIELGAEVNSKNANGLTALHMCVAYALAECEKVLLDGGADKNVESNDGHKAEAGIDGDFGIPAKIGGANSSAALLEAFALGKTVPGLDRAKVVMAGMQKKKGSKELWSAEVQEGFTDMVKSLS
mmetsp:Transcript_42114/g.51110  ORF Transcript_42114/g.51110 Transcript_42114/m.51110 type:complete len:180 (-) Transcript_42114:384-923(-)|eukprot:CAMPEP_0197859456 /NCGR_PEP_ID=MMETSP1438-20131217/34024_1 /TAXON_ID=1461541 /ORGANISM="Pterosperma sp., Strain CCMP1384" /LENGTH=179 /DNA_ID=CAMNT_0043475945 /DNA_START=21 /DNA_END=560 /DNA_ORIENTATION=-